MRGLLALVLAVLAVAGCSSPHKNKWETRGDRILGIGSTMAEDPVSGTVVDKKDAVKRDYKGTTYYFESSENAAAFMSNPTEYAVSESDERGSLIDVR